MLSVLSVSETVDEIKKKKKNNEKSEAKYIFSVKIMV